MAVNDQNVMKVGQRLDRCLWRAKRQGRARSRIQHPAGYYDHDARRHLHVDDVTASSSLAVLLPKPAPIQRMPAVENLNFLHDMSRMTVQSSSGAATGCSPTRWPAPTPAQTCTRCCRRASPTASTATNTSRRCSSNCPRPRPPRTSRRCCPGALHSPPADHPAGNHARARSIDRFNSVAQAACESPFRGDCVQPSTAPRANTWGGAPRAPTYRRLPRGEPRFGAPVE